MFAVGPRVEMSWLDTREHYHDHLVTLTDRDVAPHLAGGGHDLVAFPEDLGLMAAFNGSRGAQARASGSLVEAIVALIGSYGPVNAYYAAKYPELAQRPIPTRLLGVSLTDTFARAAVETSAEIAKRLHAYVAIGVQLVQDWHVVCTDKATFKPPPGATGCDEQDPAKVAMLRSPDEPGRDYAYEATSPKPSNMALVFDPDGRLISKQVKTYLVPDELPGVGLDLVPGRVSGLGVVNTKAGRLGFVISKDAWMPDVLDRLDHAGVDILIQPEFFGDLLSTTGMWSPDTLKASGYSALLREPSFGSWVEPSLVGGVFDFIGQAQSVIAVKPRSASAPRGHLLGQTLAPGLARVAPWAVADPVDRPILQRRRAIAESEEKLRGSGGGGVESVLWRDVEVGTPALRRARIARGGRAPFGVNRPVTRADAVQRDVALAARGDRAWAVFEEGGRLRLARSSDGARHWAGARDLGPGEWPSLAAASGRELWLAYQTRIPPTRVRVARSTDGGRTFKAVGTVAGGAAQWKPSIAARGTGGAYVAWVDERDRFAEDSLPRANVYGARVTPAGIGAPHRLDTARTTDDHAAKLDNDWSPSVAAHGARVLVAWTDFRAYKWDIVRTLSDDGGATFGPVEQVNRSAPDLESLDNTPRVSLGSGTPLLAWTDFRKTRDPAPHPLYDIRAGADRQVDGHGAEQIISAAPALAGGLLAWQDHARGVGEILVRRIGSSARPLRVQDRNALGNAGRPSIALAGHRVVVAWEDERDGPRQIYVASAPVRGNLAATPSR